MLSRPFCCQLRSLSSSSMPSQSTFQGRSEIKDVGSKLTKAISAFAYQPIKCSQKQIKANEILNLARQRSLCSQKSQKHIHSNSYISTSILIDSHHLAGKNYFVHCDCVYFLFSMFCSSLTVSSPGERCGSQFLFSHPPSHPSTPIHRTFRRAKIYGCRHGDRHGDRRGGRHGVAHGGQHGG